MATQKEIAKKLGMFQPDVSKWSKQIANNLESCLKETPKKLINESGYTIKLVKVRKCKK